MAPAVRKAEPSSARGEQRRAVILQAAIEQFSARGVRSTSMANIAAAAGVSRPALYQYFDNKDDVFAAAFVGLFEDLVSSALDALDGPGTIAERLDGFLQGYEGDLWERMSSSPYIDEIMDAKNDQVAGAAARVVARLSDGLSALLADTIPHSAVVERESHATAIELLRLAPKGFRFDQPSVAVFRRRLTALAQFVAAGLVDD